MNVTILQTIADLDDRVKAATSQFYNSAVAGTTCDPALGHIFGETELTVTDLLLVAALSQVHVLITGPTGRGKTELVKLVCQGLFGSDRWFLLRLNPHLTEDTFATVDMKALTTSGLREAIVPAPFLLLPCTILDECNRTPPALTNIILGFADGRIELKCGVKVDVGYQPGGAGCRYHLVIGTMNEGKEYTGTFDLDPALARSLTLHVPFAELRPTPHDLVNIVAQRTGHAEPVSGEDATQELMQISEAVAGLSLDPLAFVYLVYLGNVGRCPYAPSGFHPEDSSQRLCTDSECRIQKRGKGFCPSVGGLSEGVLIFLKRAACGLAALRAARTFRSISRLCEAGHADQVERLRAFAGVVAEGETLREAAVAKYVERLSVSAEDVKTMLPFVALGGKAWLAREYVSKHFGGSNWLALQEYARETYAALESFFRENRLLFQRLDAGNGTMRKLKQRLEHAERFTDPVIRHALQPFIERYESRTLGPEEVVQQIRIREPVQTAADELMYG